MKILTAIAVLFLTTFRLTCNAQETFGRTLNMGLGVAGYAGYYGHIGRPLPVFHIDYEIQVLKNFTFAPFINVYSHSRSSYWGDNNNPFKNYSYRETVIPIGGKGTYYFDDLLDTTSKWDFYVASSLGFAIVSSSWDAGYNGDRNYYQSPSSFFVDIHVGGEYHFTNVLGVFLDLSSGVSTIGLAIHGIK